MKGRALWIIRSPNARRWSLRLTGAIEIGRRLKEAKALVKHGEWGKWLEESVSYSQKTAERLIKLFEEYGPNFLEGSDGSNETPVSHLTYTQAPSCWVHRKRSGRNLSRIMMYQA